MISARRLPGMGATISEFRPEAGSPNSAFARARLMNGPACYSPPRRQWRQGSSQCNEQRGLLEALSCGQVTAVKNKAAAFADLR